MVNSSTRDPGYFPTVVAVECLNLLAAYYTVFATDTTLFTEFLLFGDDIFVVCISSAFVFIALLTAVPVSYYFMHQWLQNYRYHAALSWWIFALPCMGALIITLLTVSFQSIKAALINPVKSLRSE